SLLGRENCSSASLQELNDKFIPVKLDGMMANVCADLKTDKISDSGNFKMLVSGDRMLVQHKNKDPYYFENYAKLIFSANQIPETADKSYAYFRRWIIIPFNRTFEGVEDDKNLIEKLTTPEELSGILNLALKGLRKLKADNGFKEMDIEDIRNQYQMGASRIKSFLEEKCVIEAGNESLNVESARLKEEYRQYCRKKGTSFIDERKVGEELKALGIVHKQKRIGKHDKRYYEFGIALKDSCLNVLGKSTTLKESIENSTILGEGAISSKTKRQEGDQT
ncbi:MAG: DNA primase family protein, partial [Nitrososphaera sp.]